MSAPVICAAPGCTNPVVRTLGRVGRPPIYCSAACRPTRAPSALFVEVDRDESEQEHGRDFVVRLRRGQRSVAVANGLGRFSAIALATDLRSFLNTGDEAPDELR